MTKSKGSLLTSEERIICEEISKNGEELFNQRARVLLAIDKGMSQTKAGELAGLTSGEVDYCLQRFRQLRTASIFSTEAHCQTTQDEPEFHSRLNITFSRIEDSISQLKQTQDEFDKNKVPNQPDENINVAVESANVDSAIEDSNDQLKQADERVVACDVVSQQDEKSKLTEAPDKKKKASQKRKSKKPKGKRKKPKKNPKKHKNKKPKKRKKKMKKKK